jgi:cytochrome P450
LHLKSPFVHYFDVQEKACEELYQARIPHDPVSINAASIRPLSYLDAIVRESLRLYPTGGEGLVRMVPDKTASLGVEIRGHQIPPGTPVWIHAYSMHRSERNWIDPEIFDPDRWLENQGAASASGTSLSEHDGFDCVPEHKAAFSRTAPPPLAAASDMSREACTGPVRCNKDAFVPFGAGPRSCLGQHYSILAIKIAVALLHCYFKFELALDEDSYAVGGGMSLGIASGSMPLIVSPRVWPLQNKEEEGNEEGETEGVGEDGVYVGEAMEAWILENRGRVTI